MIDALKEVGELVKQLPELSIWILCGLLLYKVIIVGSWFGIARLLILKGHNLILGEHEVKKIRICDLSGNMLTYNSTPEKFFALLSSVQCLRGGKIDSKDLDWVIEAIEEKKARET